MNAYGGVDVKIHIFMSSALAGGEWSASRPVVLPTWEEPLTPVRWQPNRYKPYTRKARKQKLPCASAYVPTCLRVYASCPSSFSAGYFSLRTLELLTSRPSWATDNHSAVLRTEPESSSLTLRKLYWVSVFKIWLSNINFNTILIEQAGAAITLSTWSGGQLSQMLFMVFLCLSTKIMGKFLH
jgi:hypothetical protein